MIGRQNDFRWLVVYEVEWYFWREKGKRRVGAGGEWDEREVGVKEKDNGYGNRLCVEKLKWGRVWLRAVVNFLVNLWELLFRIKFGYAKLVE